MLGVAEICQPLELVYAEIGEHRIHLEDDRKFGLLAHFNVLVNFVGKSLVTINIRIASNHAGEVCHKSHNFAAPPDYFYVLGAASRPGISSGAKDGWKGRQSAGFDAARPSLESRHESS